MNICPYPFSIMHINDKGNCSPCCSAYIGEYSIGNIFQNSLEDIWNSEAARLLRRKILSGDYSLCRNRSLCERFVPSVPGEGYSEYCHNMPQQLAFGHDRECNLACPSCRKTMQKNSPERAKELDAVLETFIAPLAKNLKIAWFSIQGDPFFSKHYQDCIKIFAKTSSCKFTLGTNGLLFTQKKIEELGIEGRINGIDISIDAATPETYRELRRGGDFAVLQNNLEYITFLKDTYAVPLRFKFVIQRKNYQEMPLFADFAEKHGAKAMFWGLQPWGQARERWDAECVTQKSHPQFQNFLQILEHPSLHKTHVDLFEFRNIAKKYKDTCSDLALL